MKGTRRVFVSLLTILVMLAGFLPNATAFAATQAVYYVDPVNGNDNNNGTSIGSAFRTITKARDNVRTINSSMTGDIIVYLRSGTYTLTSTLQFNQSDSGTNGYKVIYKNYGTEVPVISGGKSITGWTLHDSSKNIWEAGVGTSDNFRQLYVNGVRATRARSAGAPGIGVKNADGYINSGSAMENWGNQDKIELVGKIEWRNPRVVLSSVTPSQIYCKQPYWNDELNEPAFFQMGSPEYIENAYELIDAEGEWYLNTSTHVLYYKPRSGENMSSAAVIAPLLEKLIEAKGTLDNRIHDFKLEGLTFSYATYLLPSTIGFRDLQASTVTQSGYTGTFDGRCDHSDAMPANISVEAADKIEITNCNFSSLGSAGLDLIYTTNSSVNNSEFKDISGSGIQILGKVTEPTLDDIRKLCTDNDIYNNKIHDAAVEYKSGVGIFVGYTEDTLIAHNEIYNLPYSGVTVGWGWGSRDSAISRYNKIENNYIHDVMSYENDGGAIYTLGAQPNSTCKGNYVKNQTNNYGALYFDEGSAYYTVDNNVVENAPRYLHIWTGTIHDITVNNTYTTTSNYINSGTRCTVTNTYVYPSANWPQVALDIINNSGVKPGYVPPPDNNPGTTNIVLNKAASASTSESGFEASKANDGIYYANNPDNCWASAANQDVGSWWMVNLGQSENIGAVKIQFRGRSGVYFCVPKSITFQTSNNGTDWNTVISKSTNVPVEGAAYSQDLYTYNINSNGQYLRLLCEEGTQNTTYKYVEFAEVEAYRNTSAWTYYNDSLTGSGLNQFNFAGTWYSENNSNCSGGTVRYSNIANDYVTFQFNGIQIKWYSDPGENRGIAAVSIDNGAESNIDLYNDARTWNQAVWTSPVLSSGTHTLKIRVTGNKNSSSSDNWILVDGIEVLQ